MAAENHLHKYKLKNLREDKDKPYWVYYCVLPNCTHYIRADLAYNKECICNRCDRPFIYRNTEGRFFKFPHCEDCTKKKARTKEKDAALDDIFSVLEIK